MCLQGEYANSELHKALTALEAERDALKLVVVALCRNRSIGPLTEQVRLHGGMIEDELADYWDEVVGLLVAELLP